MKTLASVMPELVGELSVLLEAEGRPEISGQIHSAKLERCTYDPEADAGYIYFAVPPPSRPFVSLSAPVAETISFYIERGLNLDVTQDGDLFGIEFLGRSDVLDKLREAHAV